MSQVVDLRKNQDLESKKGKQNKSKSINKIEWVAPEFVKYKKGKNWFILPAIIALVLIIIALFAKNFLLVIAIILTAFIIFIYALKEPRKIKFSISKQGIQVDKNQYRFEDLKSFWIFHNSASPEDESPEIKELSIRSKKMFIPYIKIPLDNQDSTKIRKLLLKFLPERRHPDSLSDELARKLKF